MNKEKLIRTFFACEIGDACREAARDVIEILRKRLHGKSIKWVEPEKLHLTLRFIGETHPDKIILLEQNVSQTINNIAPFSLMLGKLCTFPSERPHVIAISIQITEPLANLYHAIEQGIIQSGFAPETRSFLPHLTLGRIPFHDLPDLDNIPQAFPSSIAVKEIILFRSDINNRGSIYTPLKCLLLSGRDA